MQSITGEQLREWLKDVTSNQEAIITAVKSGDITLSTTAAFSQIVDKAKKCNEYAKAYADAELKYEGEMQMRILYQNTAYYILKAFEGVAQQSPKILEIMQMLGVTEGKELGPKQFASLALSGNIGKLISNGKEIVAGLNADWLKKIHIDAIAEDMKQREMPLDGYETLLQLITSFTSKQLNDGSAKG